MKFHQLAARSRGGEVGHQFNQHQFSGPTATSEMSPIKQHQQQVAAELNQHLLNLQLQQQQQLLESQQRAATTTALSDDEDDQEEDFMHHLTGDGHGGQAAAAATTATTTTTTTSLYDSLTQAFAQKHHDISDHQQHLNRHHLLSGASQQVDLGASNHEDDIEEDGQAGGGFLMDKNKKLFPQKLWELIHNPSIQHCLRWSQDGQRVYLNRNEFEQYYLKTANNQFHTQKAISFVRQMNMYGFRKVDDCYYENDNFRRDRKHLLKNMIRRHPNKGLFVGLDHHQLAAAAAAQQALQVNQQLQQLECQHKQRAEQALRLNNYLNQQQQQQQSQHHLQAYREYQVAAAAAGAINLNTKAQPHLNAHHPHSHSHHHHHLPQLPQHQAHPTQQSSPFAEMSSQLVAQVAAASQFSQQQQQQQQQVGENLVTRRSPSASTTAFGGGQNKQSPSPPATSQQQQQQPISHQPKKSRLLSNFYQQEREKEQQQQQQMQLHQQLQEQASIKQHLNLVGSSLNNSQQQRADQLQSALNLGSPLGGAQSKLSGVRTSQHEQMKEAKLAAHQLITTSGGIGNGSSLSHPNQAALHETLVRSLLQLKQQNEHHNHRFDNHHQHHSLGSSHDLVAALAQQHQQRTLLESLASLSSGGTGSIVDPASNSPTERTSTPPSDPPSPHQHRHAYSRGSALAEPNLIALNLAKVSSSPKRQRQEPQLVGMTTANDDEADADEDYAIKVDDDDDDDNDSRGRRTSAVDNEMAASPLDGTKKVRKFLEDQMARLAAGSEQHDDDDDDDNDNSNDETGSRDRVEARARRSIKREACSTDDEDEQRELPTRSFKLGKRMSRKQNHEHKQDLNFISKLLVSEICNRRGRGQLMDELALDEAAKYTQCFLDVLIDDASLIAGHSGHGSAKSEGETSSLSSESVKDEDDNDDLDEQAARSEGGKTQASKRQKRSSTSGGNQDEPIDVSSLSLALKLIPSKLIAAVQAASCSAGKSQRVQCELPVNASAIETS